MPAKSVPTHRFFLTQRKAKGTVLFSIQEALHGPGLSAIATFDDHDEAQLLAATLNGALLGGVHAEAALRDHAASLLGPLGKAVSDLIREINETHQTASRADAARKGVRSVTENLEQPNIAMFTLFPTTHCGGCPACGCVADEDCANCSVCDANGRGCENCGTVEVTPRIAYSLYQKLREYADRVYLTVSYGFWEDGVPDSVETQSDWFLLHCARAYDDLAADLIAGDIPAPRCLAESVALGYLLPGLGGTPDESYSEDDTYNTLPESRFDSDWEFLESGLFAPGNKAREFLTSKVIEEDLWEEWFTPYPGVDPRDKTRGFRS